MPSPYLDRPLRTQAEVAAILAKPVYRLQYAGGLFNVCLMRRNALGTLNVERYLSSHSTLEEARAAMPEVE